MDDTEIIDRVSRLSGLHVGLASLPALREHLKARVQARHLVDVPALLAALETGHPGRADELRRLARVLTTHETFFMRDRSQMALLRHRILPELIAARRASGERVLRLWSCACASGEEPATLAILVRELLPDRAQWQIEIQATDVSEEILGRARRADYGEWSFRGCDAAFKAANFVQHGERWTLLPDIRHMIRYHRVDLIQDAFPDPANGLADLDLILCRNVFIYFEPHAIGATARKLAACLRTDGVLMTAHGELRQQRPSDLAAEIHPESVIYRKLALPAPGAPPATGPRAFATARHVAQEPAHIARLRKLLPPTHLRKPNTPRIQARRAPPPEDRAPADTELETAWRLADAGQLVAAQVACERILAADRMSAGAHFLAAVLATEQGDRARARAALRSALYIDPDMIAAHVHLARLAPARANIQSALRTRDTIRKLAARLPADVLIPYMGDTTAGELTAQLDDDEAPAAGDAD